MLSAVLISQWCLQLGQPLSQLVLDSSTMLWHDPDRSFNSQEGNWCVAWKRSLLGYRPNMVRWQDLRWQKSCCMPGWQTATFCLRSVSSVSCETACIRLHSSYCKLGDQHLTQLGSLLPCMPTSQMVWGICMTPSNHPHQLSCKPARMSLYLML